MREGVCAECRGGVEREKERLREGEVEEMDRNS